MTRARQPDKTRKFRLPAIRFRTPETTEAKSALTSYYLILVPALLLGAFGVLMNFSAAAVTNIAAGVSPYQPFFRTLMIAVGALVVGAASMFGPPKFWDRAAPTMFLIALVLQVLLIPFGLAEGGNKNWLPIPGTTQTIQPSEFLKLATALLLGRSLANPKLSLQQWKPVAVAAGVPSLLAMGAVMIGSDMGTMLIFVFIALGALWVAGVPASWFAWLGGLGAAAFAFLVFVSPSRTRRVLEFLPGFGTPPSTSAPTQTDHGLWALGSGGLTGLGPGASRAKWNYLQEAHTDFILAIVGEEFGLIGTVTLLLLLSFLIYGVLRLAARGSTPFIRISAGGVAAWLLAQGIINVGTVTGLTPVIGLPFPLVSSGGSSYVFTAMAIGIMLSFARFDAGAFGRGRFDPDTAGRDPRMVRKRRKA